MRFAWNDPPRIVGHRGAPHDAPENTMRSFRAAQATGARAVELDARLTADGDVVVHHDAELGRILPGEGRIEDHTLQALQALGVPTLAEVLALPLLVNVEIKADADNAGDVPMRVWDAVKKADAQQRVLVTSFDPELADAYARIADRPAGAIYPFPPEEDDLASFPRLTFVALAQDAAIKEALQALASAKRSVFVWTVNDEKSARSLLEQGVAGLITDRPGPLARWLAEDGFAP